MELTQSQRKMLARVGPLLQRLALNGVVVEVGVFTAYMAERILQTRPDVTWHGVDNWLGAHDQPEPYKATGDVHAIMPQDRHDALRDIAFARMKAFGERATIHHCASIEAAKHFEPNSIDLVFLDADHSYEGVKADIEAWWPVVAGDGGWLGGHDYANSDTRFRFGVDRAVDEFVTRTGLRLHLADGFTWWVRKP